jgi:hypothetical protein
VFEIALEVFAACFTVLLGRYWLRDENFMDTLFRVKPKQL